MRSSLELAKQQGWFRIILVGDESYYGRFGFKNANFLKYPPPTNPDRLLYLALENNAFQDVSGLISRAE